jgi:2-polyprenyl-3-methyl-5-hydroxy-6-metoxy-1,4-benzoquinol methylase
LVEEQDTVTRRHCELCERDTEQQLLYAIRSCAIYRCEACGLGSTALPADVNVLQIYDESYFRGGQSDGYGDYLASEDVLRREFRGSIERLRRHVPSRGRLLEVGCAYGFFLAEARPYFDCVGVEVSAAAVEHSRRLGLDVRQGVLSQEIANDLGTFDAVVMLDVIEHLDRPADTLRLLASILRPNGVVMISTGDWGSAVARVMGRRWRLMTPPQHLFFFSRRTLTSMLQKAGFEVLSSTHPWKVVPVGLMAYQVVSRLGFKLPVGKTMYSAGVPVNLFDAVQVLARKSSG